MENAKACPISKDSRRLMDVLAIIDLAKYTRGRRGEVNYYLIHFLTGHACFRSYLHPFRHDNFPKCLDCAVDEESIEHALLNYPKFFSLDQPRCDRHGTLQGMAESCEAYNGVNDFATGLLQEPKRLERQRLERRGNRT